jgi:asparagine N-glycosylation enzyme membrane subunit Stt3
MAITVVALVVAVRSIAKAQDAVPAAVIITILAFAMTAAFFDQHSYWIPLLLAFSALGLTDDQAPTTRSGDGNRLGNGPLR